MSTTDLKDTDIEIRVARQPDGTFRVWVDTEQGNVFRAYGVRRLALSGLALVPDLHLDGVKLVDGEETP